MSEYLSKKALLEWLERQHKKARAECERDRASVYWHVMHEIQSGAFDAPEMEHINAYWAREGLIKHQEAEVQRLRAELCELEQERDMYKASSEVFYERLKIRDELLEQLRAQIKYYFGGDGGLAKLQDGVNKLLQERQRLIDGLLTIMNIASEDGVHWKLDRCYTTARDILKEIGVTVE